MVSTRSLHSSRIPFYLSRLPCISQISYLVTVEARGRNANKARGVYKWVPRFSEREVEKRGVVRAREYTRKSHKYRRGLLWSATYKKAQPQCLSD